MSAGRGRVATAFLLLFAVYQAAEALQTWIAPASPAGPLLMLAAALLPWPIGRWLGWRGYDAYALDLRAASFGYLVGGFGLAVLAKLAAMALGLGLGVYARANADHAANGIGAAAVAFGLLASFVPSIAEDILTRGFPLRTVGVRWTMPGFLLASAALYTLNHMWRFDWGWTEQARLFCLGLAYAAAAWRWRTLWGAVALHWGWNFAGNFADAVLPLQSVDVAGGRLLSAGVHLLLLAMLLVLPRAPDSSSTTPIRG